MLNLNKHIKATSKPKPKCKFKNCSCVCTSWAQLSYTIQLKPIDHFPS